jgi:hypothetical protein
MSGGSYEYLYCKGTDELFSKAHYIEDMAETLIKNGYEDVGRDMIRLSEYIRSAYIRVDVLSEQLRPIMKAVEWYESADIGADGLQKAVEKYRNGGEDNK